MLPIYVFSIWITICFAIFIYFVYAPERFPYVISSRACYILKAHSQKSADTRQFIHRQCYNPIVFSEFSGP